MLERRSALAVHPLFKAGTTLGVADGAKPAVTIGERPPLAILQVSAFPSTRDEAGARLSAVLGLPLPGPTRMAGEAERNVRATGPGVWQIVAAEGAIADLSAFRQALADSATIVDLSHARTALRIEGPAAARALAKHCGLDLDARVFPAGSVANTRFGHLGMTLARIDAGGDVAPVYEMLVFRGYAEFVFEALVEGAAEFGVGVLVPL